MEEPAPNTMLYRPAASPNPEAWNLPVETKVVDDTEVEAALADGWFRHPDDFPPEPDAAPKGRKAADA